MSRHFNGFAASKQSCIMIRSESSHLVALYKTSGKGPSMHLFIRLIEVLTSVFKRRRKPSLWTTDVMIKHIEIYEAIARSDVAAAKHAMEDHIQDIIDKSLRTMSLAGGGLRARELTPEELAYNS